MVTIRELGQILYIVKTLFVWFCQCFLFKLYRSKKFILTGQNELDVKGQVAVITGGGRGIGKGMALELARRGATVVIGCRSVDEAKTTRLEIIEKTGNPNIKVHYVDVGDMTSVQAFARTIRKEYPEVKLLLTNAGIVNCPEYGLNKTSAGFNLYVALHLGHFLLMNLLEENLRRAAPSRIITTSSTALLFQDFHPNDFMMDNAHSPGPGSFIPYANSKLMAALSMKEFSRRLSGSGVSTYSVCPGIVMTKMTQRKEHSSKFINAILLFAESFCVLTVEQSCVAMMHCVLSNTVSNETGRVYGLCQHLPDIESLLSDDLAKTVWDSSARLVDLDSKKKQVQEK